MSLQLTYNAQSVRQRKYHHKFFRHNQMHILFLKYRTLSCTLTLGMYTIFHKFITKKINKYVFK